MENREFIPLKVGYSMKYCNTFFSSFLLKIQKKIKILYKFSTGFTLIEVIVFSGIFAICAVFLIGILTVVTKTQMRQTTAREVNQQVSFIANTIQNLVRDASVVENNAGVTTSTLKLRMASSTFDPTFVYATGTGLYLTQGPNTILLTNEKVRVGNFAVTKYENPGGLIVVAVDLRLDAVSGGGQSIFSRTWNGSITRISAATFDSDVTPDIDSQRNFGSLNTKWNNGFFSGNLNIGGSVGVGTLSPTGGSYKLNVAGDLVFTTPLMGVVLRSPGGSCYRIGVLNGGAVTSTAVACPINIQN